MTSDQFFSSSRFKGLLVAGLILLTLFWFVSIRLMALPLIVIAFILLWRFQPGRRVKPVLIAFALAAAATISPFDVSLINAPGPPHFVPLVMGLPGPEL